MRQTLAIWVIASVASTGAAVLGSGSAAAAVITNTLHVEDIAVDPVNGDIAWVATRGGIEVYSIAARQRLRVYTTADGLATTHVRGVAIDAGVVTARSQGHVCRLQGERFECAAGPALPAPAPAVAPLLHGARVTARAPIAEGAGGALVGTAGQGLWLVDGDAPVQLSPADQVCSNHIMAMAAHQGRLYLGSFDQGLCVSEGAGFRRLDTPFRMVNDLVSTPAGLYVAASEGLYRLAGDDEGFERITLVTESGVNGLAFDGRTLYATTPATLWRIRVRRGPRTRAFWLPGGSRAVQKVAVGAGAVWLATEDKGVIRLAGGQLQVLDRAAGLPTSWVMDVAASADGKTLYAATFRHGLLALDFDDDDDGDDDGAGGTPRARVIAGVPDDWMLHASVHQGALWVGTQGGAARVEGNGATIEIPAGAGGVPHPCVHAVAHFGEDVWLATEGGLLRLPQAVLATGH